MVSETVVRKTTTGCTLNQGLKCRTKSKTLEGSSKVFISHSAYRAEMKITNKIKEINDADSFANITVGKCRVNARDKKSKENSYLEKCPEFKQLKNYQLFYKYTGTKLSDVVETDITKDNKNRAHRLLVCFRNLIHGMTILKESQISLLDIRMENILCKDDTFLFDEFGLASLYEHIYNFEMGKKIQLSNNEKVDSKFMKTIFKNTSIYDDSTNLPPELKLYYHFVKSFISRGLNHRDNYNRYYDRYNNEEDNYEYSIRKIRKDLTDVFSENKEKWNLSETSLLIEKTRLFKKSANVKTELRKGINAMITDLFESELLTVDSSNTESNSDAISKLILEKMNYVMTSHAKKIDVYSLGVVLLKFYVECLTREVEIYKSDELLDIIRHCVKPNIFERWDPEELMKAYDAYMNVSENEDDIEVYENMIQMFGGNKKTQEKSIKKKSVSLTNSQPTKSVSCKTRTKKEMLALLKKNKSKQIRP